VAGYAASIRLQGTTPRFAGGGASLTARSATEPLSISEPRSDTDRIELVGRPLDERIADRLESVGESWSQLTFFLFDPQSWR
jgi:hypothetical protein